MHEPPDLAPPHSGRNGPVSGYGDAPDLLAPSLYLNRELSWLEFNARVLAEALSENVPLLERLKFHAIVATNLDEFFMVRVAGLKQQLTGEVDEPSPDGMSVAHQLATISDRVHTLIAQQMQNLQDHIIPRLAQDGVQIVKPDTLPKEAQADLDERFRNDVFPILTPIAIDPGHPFPHVRNRSLNVGVMISRDASGDVGFAVVQVPSMIPRLMPVLGVVSPSGQPARHAFVLLEDLIARHMPTIFPGARIHGIYGFRVTRNFDLEIDDEEADDLLQTIQQELRRRERGNAVRLEVAGDPPDASLSKLVKALKLDLEKDVYRTPILNVADLMQLVNLDDRREMRDEAYAPHIVPALREADDLFAVIRDHDVLLHHPYESFESVVEFIARAAEDPDVLAIKQTLYRAGSNSPIVRALVRAAEAGKQVTAIVELKARFDEESNIVWARTLEQSGAHVVYGLLGLKTHCKCLLVVRREKGRLRRYVHLGTGNYNPTTARYYTDLSVLTARADVCEDVSSLFNLLTGYSAPAKWNKLLVSPLGLHEAILGLIVRESDHARRGRPARIIAKMNALVDADVIEALYRASQAGVEITLLVRGICCLRPQVPGVSDNIEVRAIVDRFLEHGRIFYFGNDGADEVFVGSADWMPRNFHRRVEVVAPVEDANAKARLIELLKLQISDNVKTWILRQDGVYQRSEPKEGSGAVRSQTRFIELTRERLRVAESAVRPSTRFHLAPAAVSSPAEKAELRRAKRERTEPKRS